MGHRAGAGRRLMGPVFQMMRQGLAALLACLPLLAVGAGNVAVPASSDPDAALAAVFKDIERSRLSDALEKVDTLIQRYPNFRLAHLIRGDLLLARSMPLATFGNATNAPSDKLDDLRDTAYRVIADHIRAATFMVFDGVVPSNEGRGYVLRRLLRRAARHGKLLGVNRPFLYEVVDTVVHENEGHYPELRERQAYITKVIRTEEENFGRTIDGGMKIFSDMLAEHKAKGETKFSGEDAFKLYDTYGFPIDLTREMAADFGPPPFFYLLQIIIS